MSIDRQGAANMSAAKEKNPGGSNSGGNPGGNSSGGNNSGGAWLTVGIIVLIALLAAFPLFFNAGDPDEEEPFGGADGQAEGIVEEHNPDYEPWFEPITSDLPGEVESGIFALQAALGAGVVGYVIGNFRGRTRECEERRGSAADPGLSA